MKTLRGKYDKLENEVIKEYNKLIKHLSKSIDFYDEKNESYMNNEIINIYNEEYENVIPVYLAGFNTNGLFNGNSLEEGTTLPYSLSDTISLLDKVQLVERLKEEIKHGNKV